MVLTSEFSGMGTAEFAIRMAMDALAKRIHKCDARTEGWESVGKSGDLEFGIRVWGFDID